MRKVKIKFNGLGYNKHYQADVFIYENGNLIFDGKTFNGKINICLKNKKCYKIEASFFNEKIVKYIYIKDCDCYFLNFHHSILYINSNLITFLLTDYHYDNLPIERGEIILWPKM